MEPWSDCSCLSVTADIISVCCVTYVAAGMRVSIMGLAGYSDTPPRLSRETGVQLTTLRVGWWG
jgi:hypothetical protein